MVTVASRPPSIPHRVPRVFAAFGLLALLFSGCANAGAGSRGSSPAPSSAASPRSPDRPTDMGGASSRGVTPGQAITSDGTLRTERALAALRDDPGRLEAFLRRMPKGGDLHSHLAGAVYAESFLRWAAEDGDCVVVATYTLTPPPCDPAAGRPAATDAQANGALRDRIIDAFSTRNYKPAVENGHERFFSTFDRFALVSNARTGDMLAEVSARAARGHARYLELMHTADGLVGSRIGARVGGDDDWGRLRQRILDAGLRDSLVATVRKLDQDEARRDQALGCGGAEPDAGCDVTVRYLYQVLRAFPPEQVFAQILTGFELVRADARFVGVNLVQPEDDRVAMRDYSLHMRIIAFLRELYPDVPVALHAGELAAGLVPPEGMRFHVREAVEVAGARRIGHGVDVLHEDRPYELLDEMARRRVMVEINLTSNDVILGVSGADHPLRSYLRRGVPVALSTDDEGVSRSDITREYVRAVRDQHIGYRALKRMTRNSLEYAFVEGGSLWADGRTFRPVDACAPAAGGLEGDRCVAYVEANTRARLQRSLELDLAMFEAAVMPTSSSEPARRPRR